VTLRIGAEGKCIEEFQGASEGKSLLGNQSVDGRMILK
jgi:hypothetical protein